MGLPDGESKQFLLLGGEPILSHSVRRLLAMPQVDGLVVVLHPSHTVRFASELLAFDDSKPLLIAEGGRSAQRLGARRPARGAVHGRASSPCTTAPVRCSRGTSSRTASTALARSRRRRARHRGERHAQAHARRTRVGRPDRRPRGPVGRADAAGLPGRRAARRVLARGPRRRDRRRRAARARPATRVGLVPSTPANVKITTPADLPLAGALLSWEVEADV